MASRAPGCRPLQIGSYVSAGTVVQVRVPPSLLEQIDAAANGTTRTAWLLDAARSALADSGPGDSPVAAGLPHAPGALVPGEPSPGLACSSPGCWERSTRRYGDRGLVLCAACAAAATGQPYQRPRPDLPASWSRGRAGKTTSSGAQ